MYLDGLGKYLKIFSKTQYKHKIWLFLKETV